jgi:hypothetical protein
VSATQSVPSSSARPRSEGERKFSAPGPGATAPLSAPPHSVRTALPLPAIDRTRPVSVMNSVAEASSHASAAGNANAAAAEGPSTHPGAPEKPATVATAPVAGDRRRIA